MESVLTHSVAWLFKRFAVRLIPHRNGSTFGGARALFSPWAMPAQCSRTRPPVFCNGGVSLELLLWTVVQIEGHDTSIPQSLAPVLRRFC